MNLISPYATLIETFKVLTLPMQNNCIKTLDAPKVKRRECRFSNVFDLGKFQTNCRKHKGSVNEVTLALIGISLKEYSNNRGMLDFKEMTIASSFSLVNFPSKREEIVGGNHWIP